MTHTDDLHEAIDRVARSMTAGEPSLDLAARVIGRLGARSAPRRPWLVPAAAAAALVVVSVLSIKTWSRLHTTPVAPAVVAEPAAPPVVSASPAGEVTADAAAAFEPAVPTVAPLDPPEAITQESIQPTKLSLPQLTVDAIVMPPVDGDGSIR